MQRGERLREARWWAWQVRVRFPDPLRQRRVGPLFLETPRCCRVAELCTEFHLCNTRNVGTGNSRHFCRCEWPVSQC